jgi:hypothetical protein
MHRSTTTPRGIKMYNIISHSKSGVLVVTILVVVGGFLVVVKNGFKQ